MPAFAIEELASGSSVRALFPGGSIFVVSLPNRSNHGGGRGAWREYAATGRSSKFGVACPQTHLVAQNPVLSYSPGGAIITLGIKW